MHTLFRAMGLEHQKALIWHHDDLGMTRGHGAAFLELSRNPFFCTGSVITCGAFAEEFARAVVGNTRLDLGVHLTLSGGSGFTPLTDGPSLCAPDSKMWRTNDESWPRLDPDESEVEMRAQIEKALEWGIDVTHLDSHTGTVFRPGILERYIRLGEEFHVPVMLPEETGNVATALSALEGYFWGVYSSTFLPTLKRVLMCWELQTPQEKKAWYLEQLGGLAPGVYPVLHHAAQETGEDLWPGDLADNAVMHDPEVLVALEPFKRLTYREVRDALRLAHP